MEKVNLFNCKRKKEFSMGASAKFVLKKKWGLIFFAKLDTKGGSVLGISTAIKTALKVKGFPRRPESKEGGGIWNKQCFVL